MATDKQSLANYEAILWLWDASDKERVEFLAALKPEQRIQFCDVLRDVLNNPWEGRSAIKLTKLNKLLGQNVDRIKKQVQFSGDRTPELDEGQLFRLLHDYLVLNHDGTRRLTELGRQNLEQLLMTVDAEFETYYNRDESHPDRMWNGFQNDTRFPGAGAAKTQVEPTDYGELNAKISNYYYPAGGGKPTGDGEGGGREERDERREREEYRERDSGGDDWVPSAKGLVWLYLPFFLGYPTAAIYAGFFKENGFVGLLLWLVTAFAAVKWYNMVRFAVRGWAALMQGAWIVYVMLAMAAVPIVPLAIANLVWPVAAFWLLARCLHGQRKFAAVWTGVLAAVCAASVVGVVLNPPRSATRPGNYDYDYRYGDSGQEEGSPAEEMRGDDSSEEPVLPGEVVAQAPAEEMVEETVVPHIEALRQTVGGVRWDNLLPEDIEHLDAFELDNLRAQLTVLLRKVGGRNSDVTVTSMDGLAANPDPGLPWKAVVTLNRDVMERTDDFDFFRELRIDPYLIVGPGMAAGGRLDLEFGVREGGGIAFRVGNGQTGPKDGGKVVFGDVAGSLGPAVLAGSAAEAGLARIKPAVRRLLSDNGAAATDTAAAKRLKVGKAALADVKKGIHEMAAGAQRWGSGNSAVETLPETLELAIWRLEHPGELTAEEKRLKARWQESEFAWREEAALFKAILAKKTVSPYRFDSSKVRRLETALREFEAAAAEDDFREAPAKFAAAREAFETFDNDARWQSGVSRGDGYCSGPVPEQWVLEPGYELVNGRPMKASICRNCNGTGTVTKSWRCGTCNGSGSVPNPAAVAKNIGGMFGVNLPVNVSKTITCSVCNGSGNQRSTDRCTACNGQGKTYR